MALNEQMQEMLQQDIKDAETRSRQEITKEQIESGKTAAGLAADMTPFVGGVKGAVELPEDLTVAKALIDDGYKEKDLVKMGMGSAFTALSLLGLIPGAKIATDLGKSAIKSSVKKQTDNLITPKRAEQLEYAKTLPKGKRRQFLKEVNRPTPKVFHGARNIGERVDDFKSQAKLDEFDYKLANSLKTMSGNQNLDFKNVFGEKESVPIKTLLDQNISFLSIIPEKGEDFIEPYLADLRFMPRIVNTKSARNEAGFEVEYDKSALDLIDDGGEVFGSVPLTMKIENGKSVPHIKASDLDSELREIVGRTREVAREFHTPKFSSKGEQLEKEGFAPYGGTGPLSGNSRRSPFRSDKSAFGSAQTGQHLELKGIKALSTSRDSLVSTKDVFGNRVLANLVYADLPKNLQRNISPDEYAELISYGAGDLRDEILKFGSPVSLPKSSHLEAEVALPRPQELNVKRLSEDRNRIDPKRFDVSEMKPTKGTGKLPLAERIAEGQRLVNRLFSQLDRLAEASPGYAKAPRRFYNYTKNMFNDAQSLAKYTEQYGARGTYDSFLETVANNGRYVTNLRKFANAMPDGERQNNLKALADVLETMQYKDRSAPIRARTATREMSDKDIDSILFDRPKELDIDDVLHEYGYNDLKRMAFHVTQKLNTGGLVQMNEGGAVPMKKQMELFEPVERGYAEGGLMEEGGMVDEESGNEVPPGSLREEVRDDIPAQLSEGEFVFPADVVRYIGLEKLMRMRQEAKQGLAQMEAMGQMGNGDEAVMEDDLPFDMYDLDIDDEGEYNNMAQGGMPQDPRDVVKAGFVTYKGQTAYVHDVTNIPEDIRDEVQVQRA
jgi:hypothetical protein